MVGWLVGWLFFFQTIQSNICTQFSSIWPIDGACYQSGPEWTWERWQWRSTPHSPKLQHYWRRTITLFNAIFGTLVRWVLSLCRKAVGVFYSPSWLGNIIVIIYVSMLRWIDAKLKRIIKPVSMLFEHSMYESISIN